MKKKSEKQSKEQYKNDSRVLIGNKTDLPHEQIYIKQLNKILANYI